MIIFNFKNKIISHKTKKKKIIRNKAKKKTKLIKIYQNKNNN